MNDNLLHQVVAYARTALGGQPPPWLVALSVDVARDHRIIRLRAHILRPPTEAEEDELGDLETEILAHVHWDFTTSLDVEVLPPGTEPIPLPGGFAWRQGDEASV